MNDKAQTSRERQLANLRPPVSASEARERGRNGGVASGKARREAKTLRETLKAMLSTAIPKTSPLYKNLKDQKDALGIHGTLRVEDMPLIGLIKKAAKGSPEAFSVIRDTIGEKPKDVVEQTVSAPPVVLGVFSPERIVAEKARQEALAEDLRRAAEESDCDSGSAQTAESGPNGEEEGESSAPTADPLPPEPANGPTVPPPETAKSAVKPVFFAPRR